MLGCRPQCSLCDAIRNVIAFDDFAFRCQFRSGMAKEVASPVGVWGRIARLVDSFFISNTKADRGPRWATQICQWPRRRELTLQIIGVADRSALPRRSRQTVILVIKAVPTSPLVLDMNCGATRS
jgi:hypothetical protein